MIKKELRKIVTSLALLGLCLYLATLTGLDLREFVSDFHIDLESLLKVSVIVTALLSVKYLLKFAVGLIRCDKIATFLTIVKSAIDYVTLILTGVWSLRILGADINGIIAGLGILALIIGISAEGIIEDMITGIFMLFEQEFKVGDIIEVDGFEGTVTEIGIRTTALKDKAGNEKIFNNSSLKDILNRSSYESVAVVDVEVPLDADIAKLQKANYGDIRCLGLQEIGAESLLIRYTLPCREEDIYDTRREMNAVILKVMRKLGIK